MIELDAERLDIVRRLADQIARDANQALRDAKLDTRVAVQPARVGFRLIFQPYLHGEAQKQAAEITETVLESALYRVFNKLN